MATAVLMPQVGQDIKTAKIIEWLKKENDRVNKGDIIATVESDKAAFDVEAYDSGVLLRILYPEDAEVEVLTPIAYIGQPGEKIEAAPIFEKDKAELQRDKASAAPAAQATEPKAGPAAPALDETGLRPVASPSARKLAREKGISVDTITGTGPGGRITKKDVLAAISAGAGTPEPAAGDIAVPFSRMRARIAQRLTHSSQTIPHFYLFMDVDMSEALVWKDQYNQKNDAKVTITDMIIRATAAALSEFRKINAHVEADKIILKKAINIGVVVSVDEGLIVPVISDADQKSIGQISAASRQNAEAARAGRLRPQSPGTFTISNLGMYAVDALMPIINPPECAILALGTITKRPAVVNEGIEVREIMTMTLACDHRMVDGTYAAQFLEKIKHYLENPSSLED